MKIFMFSAFLVFSISAYGYVEFKSGEYEPVDYAINDTIAIDYTATHDPGTHVDLLEGGGINGAVYSYNNGKFTLNGGSVSGRVLAHDNSKIYIKNGSVAYPDGNIFFTYEDSLIEFHGSDFWVDGTAIGYGESLKNYGSYNGTFYTSYLTGTLLDGSSISGNYFIYNQSDMIIIPEPVSLLLFSLGGVGLISHRRRVNY